MTSNPPDEPPREQGPYTEYSASSQTAGPQMPPPIYATSGAWTGAGQGNIAPPRSLWEAIQQLPKRYWRVLTKPGTAAFADEIGNGRWDIIWVQVLGLALLEAILTSLALLIFFAFLAAQINSLTAQSGQSTSDIFGFFFLPVPLIGLFVFISVLAGFFIGQGITYLLAKAFGGQGSFMTQAYTSLLYQAPIGLVSAVVGLIPLVSYFSGVVGIYGYILQTFQMMVVHRLSTGKAIAVVLIPVAVLILLVIILVALYFIFIFSLISTLPRTQ